MLHTSIKPTQLSFRPPNPLTLHSLQLFLGHLNGLRPILGLPTYAMLPCLQPTFEGAVHTHTQFPGTLAYGNHQADSNLHFTGSLFTDAFQSHRFFHQGARTLSKQFSLTNKETKEIVCTCPTCPSPTPSFSATDVSPRGLSTNEIWQMDVTHYPPFKPLT